MNNKNINWNKVAKFTKIQVRDWENEEWKNVYFLGYNKETKQCIATVCSEFSYRNTYGVYDEAYDYYRIYEE